MANGTDVAKWDEALAHLAERTTGMERVGGDFISLRGGKLSFQDEALPGNQMCVIILTAAVERTFYAQAYDPTSEHNLPPVCYAFAQTPEEQAELAPHPSMQKDLTYFQPQHHECATCPNNAWGSAEKGKGKACAERRRLALLPAGYYTPRRGSKDFDLHLFDELEHYRLADIAYLKLNVMSVKDWARYVTALGTKRRPPLAYITRVYVEPDEKSQFRVKFEEIEEVPQELFDTIMARYEEANANIVFGYNPPSGEADGAPSGRSVRR